MALLEIDGVTRRFGDFVAVDRVSLGIEAGEFFTLLGPSGCGKTTLLRMIGGFDLPDEGRILLDGVDLADRPPEERPVRTVFQSYALFPHMTVQGNVAFPLKMAKTPAAEAAAKIAEALADVRLSGFNNRFPHELSGGQRQRVAIARALVTHPTCCCSTSRWRRSTPSCGRRCRSSSSTCRRRSASRSSTSRTTRRRRWRCRIASR